MSNIDKRALREIAEAAVGAHERLSVMPPDDIFDISLAEGTQLDADITALNALNSAANPATVLALLDELEAKEKYANDRDAENEDLMLTVGRLRVEREAAEKRIAEHDRQCDQHYLNGMLAGWNFGITEDSDGYDSAFSARNKLIVAERAAGITVKGDSE